MKQKNNNVKKKKSSADRLEHWKVISRSTSKWNQQLQTKKYISASPLRFALLHLIKFQQKQGEEEEEEEEGEEEEEEEEEEKSP